MFYHFSDPRATKEDNFFNQMHQTKNDVDDDSEMSTLTVLLHRSQTILLRYLKLVCIFRGEPNEEVVGREQVQGQQVS